MVIVAMISQFIKQVFLRIRFKHLSWLAYCLFLLALLLNNSFSYLDPDFSWHIRVGQEIAFSGQPPSQNIYNYTYLGSWVDHEWLGDLLLFKVYDAFGYIGASLMFAFLALTVLVGLTIFTLKRRPAVSLPVLVVVQIFGLVAALPSLGVRLQEFGLLFLLILLVIIDVYDRHRRWFFLALLPPVFYLWATIHASFILGLFLLSAWPALKLIEAWLVKTKLKSWFRIEGVITKRWAAIYFCWSLAAFFATTVTPYRLELFSFLSGYRDNFYQMNILEWLPQYIFPLNYAQLVFLALSLTVVGLHLRYNSKRGQIEIWQLFLVVLFFAMSWRAKRHFPLFFVATFPYLVFMISSLISLDNKTTKQPLRPWFGAYLLLPLILSGASLLLAANFNNTPFDSYCHNYPCGAAKYLEENRQHDRQNLFNIYDWGGYLIWRLPDRKLFIDGRLPQVSFSGKTFLEEYYDFFAEDSDKEKKLAQYDIDLVLMRSTDKPLSIKNWEKKLFMINDADVAPNNHLRDYLKSASWREVYRDNTAVIYERP